MTAVLVCGIQHSGNKLIARLLQHHGAEALVYHGTIESGVKAKHDRVAWIRSRRPGYVIVPMRIGRYSHASLLRTSLAENVGHGMPQTHDGRVLRHYAALRKLAGIPMMVVQYEGLVRAPEKWGRLAVEFCGLEWRGWKERVYDGNAKYE